MVGALNGDLEMDACLSRSREPGCFEKTAVTQVYYSKSSGHSIELYQTRRILPACESVSQCDSKLCGCGGEAGGILAVLD